MKTYRKELWFNVPSRRALVNITPEVEACLRESGIQEGDGHRNQRSPTLRRLPLVLSRSA